MAIKQISAKSKTYYNLSDDEFTKELRSMLSQLALWENTVVDIKLSSSFDFEGRVKRDVIYLYEEKKK